MRRQPRISHRGSRAAAAAAAAAASGGVAAGGKGGGVRRTPSFSLHMLTFFSATTSPLSRFLALYTVLRTAGARGRRDRLHGGCAARHMRLAHP